MTVEADMGKIQQVLYNLLDNAIKFSLVYQNLYKHDYQILAYKDDDEELYTKVCEILDEDYDCPNVLKLLVDNKKYKA